MFLKVSSIFPGVRTIGRDPRPSDPGFAESKDSIKRAPASTGEVQVLLVCIVAKPNDGVRVTSGARILIVQNYGTLAAFPPVHRNVAYDEYFAIVVKGLMSSGINSKSV
jgi:hypothetical protein